jgi:hypothetical protein
MTLLHLLLILVPSVAWFWAKRHRPAQLWRITGAAFGAIVEPFSLGLYATFFASPLGLVTGLIGLTASLFHGAPGYEIATSVGLVEGHKVVEGIDHLWISGTNAIVWGAVYGTLGWLIDRRRIRRNANASG